MPGGPVPADGLMPYSPGRHTQVTPPSPASSSTPALSPTKNPRNHVIELKMGRSCNIVVGVLTPDAQCNLRRDHLAARNDLPIHLFGGAGPEGYGGDGHAREVECGAGKLIWEVT